MSHSTTETLVKMANQIGDFFGSQRHSTAPPESPTTSRNSGTRACAPASWNMSPTAAPGLNPLVLEALKLLANSQNNSAASHGADASRP